MRFSWAPVYNPKYVCSAYICHILDGQHMAGQKLNAHVKDTFILSGKFDQYFPETNIKANNIFKVD